MNPGRPQGAEPAAKANYQERKAFKQKVRTYGIQQRKNQTDQTFDGFGGVVGAGDHIQPGSAAGGGVSGRHRIAVFGGRGHGLRAEHPHAGLRGEGPGPVAGEERRKGQEAPVPDAVHRVRCSGAGPGGGHGGAPGGVHRL